MNVLIILAHPESGSFNHAIANECKMQLTANGHTVTLHDLYAEQFDPIIKADEIPKDTEINELVKTHCEHLVQSDGIIIVHPNWWGQPPAILKGWVDRIIRPGVAYEFEEGDNGEGVPIGLLKAQNAIVFNTSNTSAVRENNLFGDPLETIWRNCIFKFCGIEQFERRMFRIVVTSTLEQRNIWLKETRDLINKYFKQQ